MASLCDEGDVAKIVATDLETPRIFNCKKVEGTYPDTARVIPDKKEATLTIGFDPVLLGKARGGCPLSLRRPGGAV